jgi:protease IV
MKQFFKNVFASLLGTIFAFIVIFFLMIGIMMAMVASLGSKDKEVEVKANSVLKINPGYTITERTLDNPFKNLSFDDSDQGNLGLNDLIASVKAAKEDENIKGIYLELSSVPSGLATMKEFRDALADFKTSGKFIVGYGEVIGQSGYYLGSVANEVYVYPEGLMEIKGFSSEIMFLKGLLAKLEVEPQIIKVGTFKSAVEPLFLDKMSDANREQVTVYINSLYNTFLADIAASRNLNVDSLKMIANDLMVQEAKDAVKYKLLDGLMYPDQMDARLKELAGVDSGKEVTFIDIDKYANSLKPKTGKDKVAVVYAVGSIESGEGDDETIGSDRIAKAIKKAREDKNVKAIVFRVNSPGGSALASDVMWREVMLAKEAKPFIVSMGDVAASGGYYISCAADKIFAQPNTITGSIGVFGVLPNAQKFFNNKLGITFDGVKTGKYADLGNINRPLTDAERMIIQNSVNQIYASFTQKVADGRKMSVQDVDKIGQGRVWSGTDALRIGLVDTLGSLNDAIAYAASKANLEEYKLLELPYVEDPVEKILKSISGDAKASLLEWQMGTEAYNTYKQLKDIQTWTGVQARMPYTITIK